MGQPDFTIFALQLGGASIEPGEVAGAFAKYFSNKIRMNVLRAHVDEGGVYNGKYNCKIERTLINDPTSTSKLHSRR